MRRRTSALAAALAALLALAASACGDDDDRADLPCASVEAPTGEVTVATQPPSTGDLCVPEIPGTFPVALPSLGFGVAIPDGWQATVLSEDAFERLEDARLAQPFFLEAARNVAATGAVFYAAGVDQQGRVSELKIDVQSDASTDVEALRSLAEQVAGRGELDEAEVVDLEGGRIRVDYRVTLESAEEGEPIEAHGSQIFVPDGERLWALIVTSEQDEVQEELLGVFETGFVLD